MNIYSCCRCSGWGCSRQGPCSELCYSVKTNYWVVIAESVVCLVRSSFAPLVRNLSRNLKLFAFISLKLFAFISLNLAIYYYGAVNLRCIECEVDIVWLLSSLFLINLLNSRYFVIFSLFILCCHVFREW